MVLVTIYLSWNIFNLFFNPLQNGLFEYSVHLGYISWFSYIAIIQDMCSSGTKPREHYAVCLFNFLFNSRFCFPYIKISFKELKVPQTRTAFHCCFHCWREKSWLTTKIRIFHLYSLWSLPVRFVSPIFCFSIFEEFSGWIQPSVLLL